MAISRLAEDYEDAQLAFAQAGAIDSLVEAVSLDFFAACEALGCEAALRRPAVVALGSLAKSNCENQQADS